VDFFKGLQQNVQRMAGQVFGIGKPSVAAPPKPPAMPMGPGGHVSGSGLGQARHISQDQRPVAVRDTISYAEGTTDAAGYPNYKMRYGDSKGSAGTLDTSAPHPLTPRPSPWGGSRGSNASGAYQHLDSTWKEMNDGVNVPMTPEAQDAATDRLIRERTDYDYNQPFGDQIHTLSGQWASFPNKQGVSRYGQPVHSPEELTGVYNDRLGIREEEERLRIYNMR
jgi:muramidase (phage lysozyme)